MRTATFPIVAVQSFIEATRDTGYKSTGSAIAELIDNALEAHASEIDVTIEERMLGRGASDIAIRVTDNGSGMSADVLRLALQFGGSTRFGARSATGRYGMGLPNGGLSQARRLQVYSWTQPSEIWTTYLDVDEIVSGRMRMVPPARLARPSEAVPRTPSGTIVVLHNCDRLDYQRIGVLQTKLLKEFGRIFRKFLYMGRVIRINGQSVRPIDPLFLDSGVNITGAQVYGPPLEYSVRVPLAVKWHDPVSSVSVRFSELPIEEWHRFSNEEKNRLGIAKHAGVSVVRAGREIDYGWYFMGTKRKENYDDWWRCEVSFSPELDELFGVTHSKQKINPTQLITSIIAPDIERIARELNGRVRKKYAQIRSEGAHGRLVRRLEAKDYLLEPPNSRLRREPNGKESEPKLLRMRNRGVYGLRFTVSHEAADHNSFYSALLEEGRLSVSLNESHPFYSQAYLPLSNGNRVGADPLQCILLLLLSCARAECMLMHSKEREIMARFREIWSDTVAAFLS